ncbi:tyrosine-protein phosphatase non-receptor type 21-like [Ciona intestinalis]
MLVYSSDEEVTTQDYILSQKLQDQALQEVHQANKNNGSTNIFPHGGDRIKDGDDIQPSTQPPIPNLPSYITQQIDGKEDLNPGFDDKRARGPPPPYHTPSPTVFDDEYPETSIDDETITPSPTTVNSRRSTAPEIPPLKLTNMNGVLQRQSSVPMSGEPDERVLNLEVKVSEGHVLTEYDGICRTRRGQFDLDSMATRDRVKEVIPYRDCRVTLPPTEDNPTGYINASHIKVEVAGTIHKYIACQTPLDDYEGDFWQMVWQEGASIVVLIAKEIEHGKCRCVRYWPTDQDETFGDFKISCRFMTSPNDDVTDVTRKRVTRSLVVEHRGEKRSVWLLQYLGWPETGVPKDTKEFLGFMEELESIRRLNADEASVVVQCASGSGRSGVLILAELLIQCLEHNEDVNITSMLSLLRHQRIHMVQTFSQYNFVYKILISFLRRSRLI